MTISIKEFLVLIISEIIKSSMSKKYVKKLVCLIIMKESMYSNPYITPSYKFLI